MILYDKRDESLDIYELVAHKDELVKYRKKQMKQIPDNERIFVAETRVDPYGETPLLENYAGKITSGRVINAEYADNEKRKENNAYGRYHVLKKNFQNLSDNNILLDSYYNGTLVNSGVIRIQYLKAMKYFLISEKTYKYLGEYDEGKNYMMKNIIQLPESLYLLQLLEQGKFVFLNDKDISEQLALYTLSKKDEISFSELQKMSLAEINKNDYLNIANKIDNDRHILKILKK